MTNMSIQPLWLTHFIEILLVLEFQLTKFIVGTFSYKAHFRPKISSNDLIRALTNEVVGLKKTNSEASSSKGYFKNQFKQNMAANNKPSSPPDRAVNEEILTLF